MLVNLGKIDFRDIVILVKKTEWCLKADVFVFSIGNIDHGCRSFIYHPLSMDENAPGAVVSRAKAELGELLNHEVAGSSVATLRIYSFNSGIC